MGEKEGSDRATCLATRDRLLDAAERLFAEKGADGTSVRAITAMAEANLAAVGYHFGSKNELIQAAVSRRFEALNQMRLVRLDTLEEAALPDLPSLEDVIDVLLLPILNPRPDDPADSARLRAFFSRVLSETPAFQKDIRIKGLQETTDRFTALVHRILPNLTHEDVYWRTHFSAGPLVGTLTHGHRLRIISHGLCNPDDIDDAVVRLRSFICAGLRAPTTSVNQHNRQSA